MKEYFMEPQTSTESVKNFILYKFSRGREIKQLNLGAVDTYLFDEDIRIKLSSGIIKIERNDGCDFSKENIKYIKKLKTEIEKLPKCIKIDLDKKQV